MSFVIGITYAPIIRICPLLFFGVLDAKVKVVRNDSHIYIMALSSNVITDCAADMKIDITCLDGLSRRTDHTAIAGIMVTTVPLGGVAADRETQ